MPSDLPPYEKFVSEIAPSQQSCKVCIYAKLVSDIATTVLSNIMRVCAKRKLVNKEIAFASNPASLHFVQTRE